MTLLIDYLCTFGKFTELKNRRMEEEKISFEELKLTRQFLNAIDVKDLLVVSDSVFQQ